MRKITLVLLVFLTVLAVGCGSASPTTSENGQPAPQGTPTALPKTVPAITDTPASMETSPTDYPALPTVNPNISGYPAPAYPGPGGAPALEARANTIVELISQSPDAENQAQVILRVKLVSVSPVEGSPDRFTPLIGQEIDLRTNKALLPSMAPGDMFTAEVIFRGDETNSYYFAENLQK